MTGVAITWPPRSDEGTANLDVDFEKRIDETMLTLPITRIHSAHRPRTMTLTDHVIGLARGRRVDASIATAAHPAKMRQPGLRFGIMLKVAS